MDGAKTLEVLHPGTRRRIGSGTITQPTVEQERSVSAPAKWLRDCHLVVPGNSEAYKRSPREVVERQAEVGGGIVAVIGVDNRTRGSEGPPAGCAIATAKTLESRSPASCLGRSST